jgi:hypothetical protein
MTELHHFSIVVSYNTLVFFGFLKLSLLTVFWLI